ncbi:MAG: alpha/beta fold hydrolase, partial [Chloroflexota bacterium]
KNRATVDFFIEGVTSRIAQCFVNAGSSSCSTEMISSIGWYWGDKGIGSRVKKITAAVDGNIIPDFLSVNIKPRPVVMVHGFLSSWETWKAYLGPNGFLASAGLEGYAVGDGQVPGVLNTGNPDMPSARTNSIGQNAEILKSYIEMVQKKTGAEKVDLLVHSMGGMITRYYLDRVMDNDNTGQVIFLGTPMAGSACVYPVAALGYLLPASLEILPDYMVNIFDKQIIHRQGVPFYMIAGTLLVEPITSPCADAPSDTVVGLDSATFIKLDDIQKLPLYHGGMTSDQKVFENYVLHLLQNPPSTFSHRPDPELPAASPDNMQFSRVYTGHLNPGETSQIVINIDPEVSLANFSLYDDTKSLQVEVKGASGKIITLDLEHNGLIKIDDPDIMLYLGYGFKQPKPGKWTVSLKSTEKTPAKGLDYAVNARFIGGASIRAASNPTIPGLGQPVDISASISTAGGNLPGIKAEIMIRKPDSSQELIPMQEAGDSFTAKYLPDQAGIYSAEIRMEGMTKDGFGIDRAAFLAFEVQPGDRDIQNSRMIFGLSALIILLGIIIWLMVVFIRRKGMKKAN